MNRQSWRLTTKRTIGSGLSSTWMLLTCASPPLLQLHLRARLRTTAWTWMSADQVCDLLSNLKWEALTWGHNLWSVQFFKCIFLKNCDYNIFHSVQITLRRSVNYGLFCILYFLNLYTQYILYIQNLVDKYDTYIWIKFTLISFKVDFF